MLFKKLYHSNVLKHFNFPQNTGSFAKDVPNVSTAIVGAPACGDVMKLQIQVVNDIIVDTKFKTFGCGSAIASSSLATELIKSKHINEAIKITNKDIAKYLNLPPVKLHCSLLAKDAIKAAINDYKKKQES